jgi:UDP-N-acetylmuramyl tripeptide synthase
MDLIASYIGYLTSFISRVFHIGAGATWPGEVALRLSPVILRTLSKRLNKGTILIVGTNGKTTTSLMIKRILEAEGGRVVHNGSGANLLNGVVSALVTIRGQKDWGVFEIDENVLPIVLQYITPTYIVLLNLFRDQLDRYGEVDAIAEKWKKALLSLDEKTTVIANADDPLITAICENLQAKKLYIGLENPALYRKTMQHATDTIYCPKCGTRLTYGGIYYSHLGKWSCGSCGFTHPDVTLSMNDYHSSIEGIYNNYNAISAAAVGESLNIEGSHIQESLAGFAPAFGRMEQMIVREHNVRIVLSKNPTGFNESLQTYLTSKSVGPLLILLNDRIPDGTDVSWIWDVDFELLDGQKRNITVSGDRAYDMAVRIKYALHDMKRVTVTDATNSALDVALSTIKPNETLWILATYSAMLDVRKIITGRKIL